VQFEILTAATLRMNTVLWTPFSPIDIYLVSQISIAPIFKVGRWDNT